MNENKAKYDLLLSKLKGADKKQIEAMAQGIADKVVEGVTLSNKSVLKELRHLFADLSVETAALSGTINDANNAPTTDFDKLFKDLSDSLDKDVIASLNDEQVSLIAEHIGEQLSKTVSKLNIELARNLADKVEIKNLEPMLKKLIDKIPNKIDGKVTLAYNKVAAKDYINVRITDGNAFIDSVASAVRGVGLPLIKTGSGVMALPVVNPDGTNIGGTSSTPNDDLVLMEYDGVDDNLIYVGTAPNGSSQASDSWAILRMDLTNLLAVTYAPNYLTSGDVWDDRESLF